MLYQNLDRKPGNSTVMTCCKCNRHRMVSPGYAQNKGELFECSDLNFVKCGISEDITEILTDTGDTADMERGSGQKWNFKRILMSKRKKGIVHYKIEWDNGQITWEPKSIISESDPESVLEYEKSLLGKKRNKRKESEISSGIFNMIISNTEGSKKRSKN